jgi:hypothetical protein
MVTESNRGQEDWATQGCSQNRKAQENDISLSNNKVKHLLVV